MNDGKAGTGSLTIAHISDLHLGSNYFVPNLLQRTIVEVNELNPEAVIITGDLTDEGFRQQYKSVCSYLETIKCKDLIVVPGNHDARNVGYVHFEELIGPRFVTKKFPGVTLVAADSSEPDLNDGRIGRETYAWLEDSFADNDDFKIFAMHHHLLPIPGTGRERNIVYDAGDVLEVLIRLGVDLVLTGHKHVPHSWKLEELYVVNAGTCSTLRLRGKTQPCYNVVQFTGRKVKVYRKYPFGGKEVIVDFSIDEHRYCPWIVPVDAGGDGVITADTPDGVQQIEGVGKH